MKHPKSQILSDYLDGEIAPRDAEELKAHLEECVGCTSLLRELEEVQDRARALPDRFPTRDLWPGIQRAIEREGAGDPQIIELHPRTGRGLSSGERRGLTLTYFQAAAAGVVLALFSGSLGAALLSGPRLQAPVATVQTTPSAEMMTLVSSASPGLGDAAMEVAQLEELLAQHRDQLDPATARILENNLAVIDRAIRESVAALRSDPGNAYLEKHLARSVETKASYLKEATAFVAPVS